MKRRIGAAAGTPGRVWRAAALSCAIGLAATGGALAASPQGLASWPSKIPTSPRYQALWSGSAQCGPMLKLMRGQPTAAATARWRRPADLKLELGADAPRRDELRVARVGAAPARVFANTPDAAGHTYRNTLALLSDDGDTLWPVAEGLVMRDAANVAAAGGISTLRYPCRACAGGERTFQPDVRGVQVATDVVTVGARSYQLYASLPARFASVWALREGTSDPKAANHPVCLFVRK